jgi:hypothetical protein
MDSIFSFDLGFVGDFGCSEHVCSGCRRHSLWISSEDYYLFELLHMSYIL